MAVVRIAAKQGQYRFGWGVPVWEDRTGVVSVVVFCYPGYIHRHRLFDA